MIYEKENAMFAISNTITTKIVIVTNIQIKKLFEEDVEHVIVYFIAVKSVIVINTFIFLKHFQEPQKILF